MRAKTLVQRSRVQEWLDGDRGMAPARERYRLVRETLGGGDTILIEQSREGVKATAFDKAMTDDQATQTGWVSYRLLGLSSNGEVIASLPMRARGTAQGEETSDRVGLQALASIVKQQCETQRDDYRELFGQQMAMLRFNQDCFEMMFADREEMRGKLEDARMKIAVDRATITDPVREAQAKLWEQLGSIAQEAPALIGLLVSQLKGGGSGAAQLPSGPAVKEPDEDVAALCVALSSIPRENFREIAFAISRSGYLLDPESDDQTRNTICELLKPFLGE